VVGPLESLVMFLVFGLFSLLLPVGLLYLGYRFVRAHERRAVGSDRTTELNERILRLEERLESVAGDMEKLLESQQFTTKLLSERAGRNPESEK
jgi:hypothetical protein